jgi:hypothetical protein
MITRTGMASRRAMTPQPTGEESSWPPMIKRTLRKFYDTVFAVGLSFARRHWRFVLLRIYVIDRLDRGYARKYQLCLLVCWLSFTCPFIKFLTRPGPKLSDTVNWVMLLVHQKIGSINLI